MKGQRKFLKYTKIAAIGRAADNPLMPTHGPVEVAAPISRIREIRPARQNEASSNDPWSTVRSIVEFPEGKDYVVETMDELLRRIETPYEAEEPKAEWTVEYRSEVLGPRKYELKEGTAHRGLHATQDEAIAAAPYPHKVRVIR